MLTPTQYREEAFRLLSLGPDAQQAEVLAHCLQLLDRAGESDDILERIDREFLTDIISAVDGQPSEPIS